MNIYAHISQDSKAPHGQPLVSSEKRIIECGPTPTLPPTTSGGIKEKGSCIANVPKALF